MLCALRMMAFSQAAIKVNSGSGDPKVSKGRSQTSSVLTALWSPPQRRNPCLRERPAMVGSQAAWSRPSGATLHRCWVEQLGGASEDAQSYWQGRCPCTLQGALPLDPFFASRLERACLIVLTCCLCPESASRTRRCPGRHRAPPSPSNPVSDPHTRGLSLPKSSHCPTISAGMSQF